MDTQTLAYYLAWICILHLSVFSFILFSKRHNRKANVTLGFFMLVLTSIHISHLLLISNLVYKYYWINMLCFIMLFFEGPVFLRYTALMAGKTINWKKKLWLHLLPFLAPIFYALSFVGKNESEIRAYYQAASKVQPLDATLVLAVVTAQATVYWFWSLRILRKYNKRLEPKFYKSQLSLRWLSILTIVLIVSSLVIVPLILYFIQLDISALYIYMPLVTMSIYLTLFYKSVHFPGSEFEKKLIVEQIRQRISRDMHDELGAGITKIALLSGLAKGVEYRNVLDEISGNATQLSKSLKEIIGDLNPESTLFSSMLSYIREYTSEFLEDAGLTYTIDLPENIQDFTVSYENKHNLLMIIKEALNNIVKHASAREVSLSLEFHTGLFLLTIKDDGLGLNICPSHLGNGLKNMAHRASQIGADFKHYSEGGGLVIMVGNIHLNN